MEQRDSGRATTSDDGTVLAKSFSACPESVIGQLASELLLRGEVVLPSDAN